jgi:tetratricopeptide (TPR) repeat protein
VFRFENTFPLVSAVAVSLLSSLALLGSVASVQAHPELSEQIDRLSAEMRRLGPSPERLRERAELHRRHGEFTAALADLDAAAQLGAADAVRLDRARVLCDAGRLVEALPEIERTLAATNPPPEAWVLRARCRAASGEMAGAIADYTTAIERLPHPGPDLYLARARLQAAQGNFSEAVRGLDEGVGTNDIASPLLLTAVEYDRQRGAFDAALQRVDRLVARYPVKEPWLTLRAEILEQAGRITEAAAAFDAVLAGIAAYPATRRQLDLTRQLEARATAGRERTLVAPQPPAPIPFPGKIAPGPHR